MSFTFVAIVVYGIICLLSDRLSWDWKTAFLIVGISFIVDIAQWIGENR